MIKEVVGFFSTTFGFFNVLNVNEKSLLNHFVTFLAAQGSTDAVVQRCFVKKVFLKIPQNLQEKTCARVTLLIKLQASGLQLYHKRDFWHRCLPLMAASGSIGN